MDEITQQNAALVEEASAASEAMSLQAREVLDLLKAVPVRGQCARLLGRRNVKIGAGSASLTRSQSECRESESTDRHHGNVATAVRASRGSKRNSALRLIESESTFDSRILKAVEDCD